MFSFSDSGLIIYSLMMIGGAAIALLTLAFLAGRH